MKYGRHQIDKAGEIIMSSKNNEDYDNAMLKINEWRTLHLPALDTLQKELLSLLNPNKTDIFLTSRRLKRITSILYKLDINPEMRLGGMQDIGGFRIVVNDIEALLNTKKVLSENIPTSFDLVKIMDYIQEPKESGYRSIHFIYKNIITCEKKIKLASCIVFIHSSEQTFLQCFQIPSSIYLTASHFQIRMI